MEQQEKTSQKIVYGKVARFFHWGVAALIFCLLPMGLFMEDLSAPFKFQVYGFHKMLGICVLSLTFARLVWRILFPPPAPLDTHRVWEQRLARATHVWLYLCMLCLPLSGWLMSSAAGYPVPFFGMTLPALIAPDQALAHLFAEGHEFFAFSMIFALVLHIAGTVKHVLMDKDESLARMLGGRWAQ